MKREQLAELCVAVSLVPKALQKENVVSFIQKHSILYDSILDLDTVEGIESNKDLTRWVLLFQNQQDVAYLINVVQTDNVEVEGCTYNIIFQKAIAYELPEGWEEKYKSLEPAKEEPRGSSYQPVPRQFHPPLPFPSSSAYPQGLTNLPPGICNLPHLAGQFGPVSGVYAGYHTPVSSSQEKMEGMQTSEGEGHSSQSSSQITQSEVPLLGGPIQGYFPPLGHGPFQPFAYPGFLPFHGQGQELPDSSQSSHNISQSPSQGQGPYAGAVPPYPRFPFYGLPPNSLFGQQNASGGLRWPFPPKPVMIDPSTGQFIPVSAPEFPSAQQQHVEDYSGDRGQTDKTLFKPGELPPPYNIHGPEFVSFVNVKKKIGDHTSTDDKPEIEAEDESEHAGGALEKPTKITVSNLPSYVTEQYLKLFFDDTKMSGGGSVLNVEFNGEEGLAVIEFEEPEVVQRVLSRRPVIMLNEEIDVNIFVPELKRRRTIEVTGPQNVVSKEQLDALERYFENQWRSGGGEVVDRSFDPEKNMALFKFQTEEIASRVVDRVYHVIKNHKINVLLHIPETKTSKMKQAKEQTAELAEVDEDLKNKKRLGDGEYELIKSDDLENVIYVNFNYPEEDTVEKEPTNIENKVSLGSTEDFDICCDPCLTVDHRSEAQAFCISCQENLCRKCFDTHRKLKFSRNHKVNDTPRKLAAKSFVPQHQRAVCTESCTLHRDEFIKFFCQQHNTLGCNDCMTLYHRTCDIDYIPAVCIGITNSRHYKDILSDVKKAVQERQDFAQKVKSLTTETKGSIEKAAADIEDFQVKVNDTINKMKVNLLQQLKSHESNNTRQADEILSTNKTVLSELKTLEDALEKSEISGQDAEAYITMRQTQSRLQAIRYQKELYEAEMRKYNFVHSTALQDILSSCECLGEISSSPHFISVKMQDNRADRATSTYKLAKLRTKLTKR